MIILRLAKSATTRKLQQTLAKIRSFGGDIYAVNRKRADFTDVICNSIADEKKLRQLSGILKVIHPKEPYVLASRSYQSETTLIKLGKTWRSDSSTPLIVGGPCSVESRSQVLEIAHAVKEAGANAFRGGAFKPRTSPYSFQGIGNKGYEYLAEVREKTGLPVISEVMSAEQAHIANEYVDVLQVGARNMQNTPLLNAVGKLSRPVLLKRGLSATIEEFLLSAEYILRNGNRHVILCERGIRTFEQETRFTFDLNAVPAIKEKSHLLIVGDPSHATGKRQYVESVALGAIAAGADGIMVEVDTDPDAAKSDSSQTINVKDFNTLAVKIRQVYNTIHSQNNPDSF